MVKAQVLVVKDKLVENGFLPSKPYRSIFLHILP